MADDGRVYVECLQIFHDREYDEIRSPDGRDGPSRWYTTRKRASGLISAGLVQEILADGSPINSVYPWGEAQESRFLETAQLEYGRWNRVVACLNIWNDLEALRETWDSWYPYVDHVIAVDGVYGGSGVVNPHSDDGTLSFLNQFSNVDVIPSPAGGQFWPTQVVKRNAYFDRSQEGDLLFVVDADEFIEGAEKLKDLPYFDVGWLPYKKNIYQKEQNFPRLFNANINPRYTDRHYWVMGDKGFITDCQYGSEVYDHMFIPIYIDNAQARKARPPQRQREQERVLLAQRYREAQVGTTQTSGRESLRITQLAGLDAGMVVFRLHSAINSTSPHESAMGTSRHNRPYDEPYQWDLTRDRDYVRSAAQSCDILHCHLSYHPLERLGIRQTAPVVIHHHGTMYRSEPERCNNKDARKANVRLVSNPELLKYGEDLYYLPNPVPVERYRRMRQSLYEPDPDKWIRVGHSPSKRHLKGTEDLLEAIENLRSKGMKIRAHLIENKTHEASLFEKAKYCDIFFDSFWLGAVQCSGIEAGAMGIPTIGGDEDVRSYFNGDTPYLFANDQSSLEEWLAALYENPELGAQNGHLFRMYVQDHHDYAAVTKRYLDILDEKLDWRDRLNLGGEVFLTA